MIDNNHHGASIMRVGPPPALPREDTQAGTGARRRLQLYEGGGVTTLITPIESACGGCALLATLPGTLELFLVTLIPDRRPILAGGAQAEYLRLGGKG
jgi:hypothetical protein